MFVNPDLSRARVRRALDERIAPLTNTDHRAARVSSWTAPGEPVPFAAAVREAFEPVDPGMRWGSPWRTTWFRIEIERPAAWPESSAELLVELGFTASQDGFQAEGLAYTESGGVIKAVNPRSRAVPVEDLWDREGRAVVYVEAAANPRILVRDDGEYSFRPTPLGDPATAGSALQYTLGFVGLVRHRPDVQALYHDLEVLAELERELPPDSTRRHEILVALDRALALLGAGDEPSAVRNALADVLRQPAVPSAHRVSAVGHAHIDSAWLWPFRETRRKVARTVANVLALMTAHPELTFAMSSAQQYAWLKEDHPELFDRVRVRVDEGRFVPVGGMWVEADTNMPSGEALIRQFVEGGRFFGREFGVHRPDIVWLPDSFGYSAALPQIIRLAGATRFLTQKMSWNDVNLFPHHTFWWEGIDGSRVYTHFPPVDTYHAELRPAELAHAERRFQEKGRARHSLVPFGYGDGGGGPTREMIERGRRMADLEGSPRVHFETPGDYFDAATAELPDPATWSGELYLELHRGAYTTQARTKRGNRRAESLLRAAELWSTQANVRAGVPYPGERLAVLWRRLLLLHFHDVLPGTSIAWVHQEAEREFDEITTESERLVRHALAALAGRDVPAAETAPTTAVVNSSPVPLHGVAAHAVGVAVLPDDRVEVCRHDDGSVVLRNRRLRVEVARDGTIRSLTESTSGREVIPTGRGAGSLHVHPDSPARWDAWDIDEPDGNSEGRHVVLGGAHDGPPDVTVDAGSAAVRVSGRTGSSAIARVVRLTAGGAAVEIDVDVDWRESNKLLTVEFPVDVLAERWSAETQFGHVSRSTTVNTSWDAARFEACAHRWVHVREPGFGVTVANESSYGYQVARRQSADGRPMTVVRASLLRASTFPDPQADHGRHSFRFSLRPATDVVDAVAEGHRLCDPVFSLPAPVSIEPLVTVASREIIVDTVKSAEDGTGDVILRLYEATGSRQSTQLAFGLPVASVREATIYEEPGHLVATEDELVFAPFQIRTLRIAFVRR